MRLSPGTAAFTVFLAGLTAVGPLSTDMYLPSLPAIAETFGASTGATQLTLSVHLIGFAGSQLFYGPLADRYGRRPVLLGGFLLYMIGCFVSLFVASIEQLIAARLLQAVTDASPDAVIAKDLHGRYLLFSRAAEAMTGKRAAEVLGRDVRMLLPPAEAAVAMERDRAAMRERRVVTTEERLTTVMGERVFLTTRGPLRDAEGRVVGVFDISRDITDRAAADAALRVDRQRLADSLEELQRFNDVLVDRELAMVDLKRRLSAALAELGRPDPFDLEALGSGGVEDA